MISHLVDEASKKIPSVPLLVNVVSKRVRQLNAGHKPMVDVIGRMGLADIALKEIIEGKLGYELKQKEDEEG
jgi:DNA-directed RNA polymerase subunit omega